MRSTLRIALESTPRSDDVDSLWQALRAFNVARVGFDDLERLFLSVREGDGALAGGLVGGTYWGWLFVDLLFVKEAHRGDGIGSDLLARAEALAVERGVKGAYLDTFSFQAEEFYTRRGYATFGALEELPPGHRRVWMRKTFGDTETTWRSDGARFEGGR